MCILSTTSSKNVTSMKYSFLPLQQYGRPRVYSFLPPALWTSRVDPFNHHQYGRPRSSPFYHQQCTMDVKGVFLSTTSSLDVRVVFLSTTSSMNVRVVFLSTTNSMDVQGVSFLPPAVGTSRVYYFYLQQYGLPGCIPVYHQ